ncbi:hypothetical protein [Actinacidiphila sp. bgisy144]
MRSRLSWKSSSIAVLHWPGRRAAMPSLNSRRLGRGAGRARAAGLGAEV